MTLSQLTRTLYRVNRAAGDIRAMRRGTLARRLMRRAEYRGLWMLVRAMMRGR